MINLGNNLLILKKYIYILLIFVSAFWLNLIIIEQFSSCNFPTSRRTDKTISHINIFRLSSFFFNFVQLIIFLNHSVIALKTALHTLLLVLKMIFRGPYCFIKKNFLLKIKFFKKIKIYLISLLIEHFSFTSFCSSIMSSKSALYD